MPFSCCSFYFKGIGSQDYYGPLLTVFDRSRPVDELLMVLQIFRGLHFKLTFDFSPSSAKLAPITSFKKILATFVWHFFVTLTNQQATRGLHDLL
jgi:hypothetical protein